MKRKLKKSIPFWLGFSLLVGLIGLGAASFTQHPKKILSVNGVWADSNSTNFAHCYAIISEEGDRITFSHYLEYNHVPMVEIGTGVRKGNQIRYDVSVTRVIPGWANKGTHVLDLSEDGNTLSGYYMDAKGNKGPLVFKRLRPY